MNNLTEIFQDDPEVLQALEMKKQTRLLADIKAEGAKPLNVTFNGAFIKGDKGDSPTSEQLISLIQPLIPEPVKGDNGYTPVKGKDYRDGIDAVPINEEDILKKLIPHIPPPVIPRDGIDGTNTTAEEVLALIRSLEGKEAENFGKKLGKMIDISYIRNAQTFMFNGKRIKIEELMHGGGSSTSSSITYSSDISSQCNGSNLVFTIPTNTSVILLTGTDAPIIYKQGTDYILSGVGNITLTMSGVNAPSLGATLIVTYIV